MVGKRIRASRVPGAMRSGWVSAGPCPQRGSLVAVDVLEERAAGERVDGLEAAAHAEDGEAAFLRGGPCRVLEGVAVELDGRRSAVWSAVALRVQVGAAADEKAIHGRERLRPGRLAGGRVEDDRLAALARDRGRIQRDTARRQLGLRLPPGDGNGDDDPGLTGGLAHRDTIAPRCAADARRRRSDAGVSRRPARPMARRQCSAPASVAASAGSRDRLPCAG